MLFTHSSLAGVEMQRNCGVPRGKQAIGMQQQTAPTRPSPSRHGGGGGWHGGAAAACPPHTHPDAIIIRDRDRSRHFCTPRSQNKETATPTPARPRMLTTAVLGRAADVLPRPVTHGIRTPSTAGVYNVISVKIQTGGVRDKTRLSRPSRVINLPPVGKKKTWLRQRRQDT